MSKTTTKTVATVARATTNTFDDTVKFLPVVGNYARKSPIRPSYLILAALFLSLFTGGLWFMIKLLVLGGFAFHTWFLNPKTKNNKTLKYSFLAGAGAAFWFF
jgi:hypothetical protein